jgi:hypothetical protein
MTLSRKTPVFTRRKIVTMCAAGLNTCYGLEKTILAVGDRRFSWGVMSTEAGWKMQTVHRRWRVMFAGPLSPMTALIDAVKTAVASAKKTPFREFGRQCSLAYREERQRTIETEILARHDINTYAEYQQLKNTDRPFFDWITDEIRVEEEQWNLLFMGFDDSGRPHLFVITEYGRIQWCDSIGFATIGSGAWTGQNALARFGFNRFMTRAEATYGLLAAKFAAESADGVGETTGFALLTAKDKLGRMLSGLNEKDIEKVKTAWKGMAKIPNGVAADLERALTASVHEPKCKIDNPLTGYASVKRSSSRKSKQAR